MGSRIIITTRSRSVLDKAEVKCKYELEGMVKDESLVLFSRHAFRRDSPPYEFESLSRAIVSTTGGLPLALEVIGSFLCGRNQAFWQDALKKFQKVPHEKVQEKLKISYDALNYEEKQIFLDIAWDFQMDRARWAFHMWDACNFFPNMVIETLCFMSLIKIGDDEMLQMHDQLRDLGREIIRQEDYHAPMNRSRVLLYEEDFKIFQRNKGIENLNVQALALKGDSSQSEFTTEQFEKLLNLRCLVVLDAKLIGDSKILLPKLRILKLDGCRFMATKFHMEKLVVLLLSRSDISEHWEGWSYLKVAKQLKALVLTNCPRLRVTLDLSTFRHLEILIIKECGNLELIHPSIGEAKGLSFLSLDGCVKLRELPQEMGKLEELKELYIGKTAIEEIPPCISSLKKLKILRANGCESLVGIPRSISHLVNLSIFDLTNCSKLCRLPESIGSLVNLQQLLLRRAQFSGDLHIPNSIGKLEWLTILDLSFLGICKLPESIGDMKNLTILTIHCCENLSSLPSTISKLGNLEQFYVTGCKSLGGEIPTDGLSSLKILRLCETSVSGFLGGFDKLSRLEKLEELDAKKCKNLGGEILIDGLSSPRILRLGWTSVSSFSMHSISFLVLRNLKN
ncbi:probable disease resistance protein RPP1 isoform X1 [Eucalyptus grandis]|uniref:probable disease resistance protein RPP1 isoform X1 n=1 Tax=Eucalyptus grandis TaxID=71139 RepID=UPI00192ED5BE|nr:probable disease resistance protein RPP1 isoform X1 [Eucalyptus grandis]